MRDSIQYKPHTHLNTDTQTHIVLMAVFDLSSSGSQVGGVCLSHQRAVLGFSPVSSQLYTASSGKRQLNFFVVYIEIKTLDFYAFWNLKIKIKIWFCGKNLKSYFQFMNLWMCLILTACFIHFFINSFSEHLLLLCFYFLCTSIFLAILDTKNQTIDTF